MKTDEAGFVRNSAFVSGCRNEIPRNAFEIEGGTIINE